MATSAHVTLRNTWLQALIDFLGNAALLRLYDADAVMLSEHVCGTPFAPAPMAGVLTRNPIASAVSVAAGNAMSARFYKADGVTLGLGGMTVGDQNSSAQVKLAQVGVFISLGQTVFIDNGTIQAGNA
jgi:hypothetical protein